jgi:hypothetical protein
VQSIELGSALETLLRVVAVIIPIVGLIIATQQLTLGARLRRRQTWLREELSHEKDTHRIFLLDSVLGRASASLVASVLVPNKYLIDSVFWLVYAAALVFLSFARSTTVTDVIGAIFFALIALTLSLRRGIRVYSERRRIAFAYRTGGRPIASPKLDIVAQIEGGTRLEFLHAFLLSLFVICLAAGISLYVLGVSALISFSFATIGTGGAWMVLSWINSYSEKRAQVSYASTTL